MKNKPCLFCLEEKLQFKYLGERKYLRCECCQGIFLDPLFRLSAAEEKKRYELHDNSLENKGYRQYLEKFIAVIEDFPTVKVDKAFFLARILDYGCGPIPALCTLFRTRGYQCRGYDPFFASDTDFYEEGATLITCLEVAEHFAEPRTDFALMARALSPGGILVVGTQTLPYIPSPDETPFDWSGFSAWWYRQDSTHISFYTAQALRSVGESAGLLYLGEAGPHVHFFKKA